MLTSILRPLKAVKTPSLFLPLLTKNQLLGKLAHAFLREQPVEDPQISVGFPQSRTVAAQTRRVVFNCENIRESSPPCNRGKRIVSRCP
jgi:hypothetical protein